MIKMHQVEEIYEGTSMYTVRMAVPFGFIYTNVLGNPPDEMVTSCFVPCNWELRQQEEAKKKTEKAE